jgi:hypothetical protein
MRFLCGKVQPTCFARLLARDATTGERRVNRGFQVIAKLPF